MKSFKVMFVPNKSQRTRLFQFAGTARFAYNRALRKEIDAYEAGEKFISNFDLRKDFTVLRNSAEYPWLRTISNNVTKQAIKDCVDAYQKFFRKQSLRPRANVVATSAFIRTRTKSESRQRTSNLRQ